MLYTKPINDIEWNDVETFCQQEIKEGAYLDYKKDFPNNLEKTLSAMANTFGGLVLIGIEENDDNSPKIPIEGIQFNKGYSEKVTNIILSNISPPFFPEIQVCKNKKGDKAVIVIRIPQSHQTPHAIKKNTRVYLRTYDVNTPEELASINEISWLSDSRILSTNLKNTIQQNANSRFDTFYNLLIDGLRDEGREVEKTQNGMMSLSVCPTFPKNEFLSPIDLREVPKQIQVPDYFGTNSHFPPQNTFQSALPRLLQDGVACINYIGNGERMFYAEINTFGLYYYQQPIMRKAPKFNLSNRIFLSGAEIITRVDEFIDSANNFFETIGYWGFVDLNISLKRIYREKVLFDWYNGTEPNGQCPDSSVAYKKLMLAKDLKSDRGNILISAIQKLFRAFGIDIDGVVINRFLEKMNKG